MFKINDEIIPGYRLQRRLGEGGFGEVWQVEAPGGLHKAIKIVSGALNSLDEESKLDRELKGLARVKEVRHPFILTMERYEVVNNQLIIVMELADRDLSDRLRECQQAGLAGIPRDELINYLLEAAEALDLMAVEHDIQHLDIKPSNIFLIRNHVKVADFGLAKVLEEARVAVTSGMTPVYAAPETFEGFVTRFTDQYSLAVLYQELLTGKRPFPGPSPRQFMMQHITMEPNLESLPDHDRPIVKRALEKTPESRWESCSDFIQRLRKVVLAPAETITRMQQETPVTSTESSRLKDTGPIIGIDLGTTNSVVAVIDGREPKVIVNQEGFSLTPSVVAFTDKDRLVGQAAKTQATINAERTIHSIKRFMGRRVIEVAEDCRRVAYKVIGSADDLARVQIADRTYFPPEISAMILQKLKGSAEEYLNHPVHRAVITVPAYFNDAQRQATKDAGQIAGLEVVRILNEPTAAALAYGMHQGGEKLLIAFDLGGGTFDITVLRVMDGVFDVLATDGDSQLGGDDFDQALVDYLADLFLKENQLDPRHDPLALGRMREAAENAKKELSLQSQTSINLPFLAADTTGAKHLMTTITREQFERLIEPLIDRLRRPCQQVIKESRLNLDQVDEVLLVGGSTRVPRVRELVRELFGKEPNKSINPDESVALGAAIHAGILSGKFEDLLLLDVTPLSLGLETKGGLMSVLIQRNTTIPAVAHEEFTNAQDNQTEVGIHILQGEREFASDNRTLGMFWLEGLEPGPRQSAKVKVTFEIDANGILNVSARDQKTGTATQITVESNSGLSKSEIERMQQEAKQFAEQDRQRRESLQVRELARKSIVKAQEMREAKGITREDQTLLDKGMKNLQTVLDQAESGSGDIATAEWQLDQTIRVIQGNLEKQAKTKLEEATKPKSTSPVGSLTLPGLPSILKKE